MAKYDREEVLKFHKGGKVSFTLPADVQPDSYADAFKFEF